MPATMLLCERNGASPGIITENVVSMNWKTTDDSSYRYTNSSDVILAGTNSYEKYQYLKFDGDYSELANVTISHLAGDLPVGVRLMISPSMTTDNDRLSYHKPSNKISTKATYDLSATGTSVKLFLGTGSAADPGKAASQIKPVSGILVSNYIVTQLQTTTRAVSGDMTPIIISISFDES